MIYTIVTVIGKLFLQHMSSPHRHNNNNCSTLWPCQCIRTQLSVQGLINLADNREEDGGFQIVPGFHKVFSKWVDSTRNSLAKDYSGRMVRPTIKLILWRQVMFFWSTIQAFIVLPDEDPVSKQAQRIRAPAGSLFIWNQLMAHGSAPNASHRTRYRQCYFSTVMYFCHKFIVMYVHVVLVLSGA